MRYLAPAKLNLYLRVVGKRPDGYHELETLFERIDLADELTFAPADALSLTCDASDLSTGLDNLVLRAARALAAAGPQRSAPTCRSSSWTRALPSAASGWTSASRC